MEPNSEEFLERLKKLRLVATPDTAQMLHVLALAATLYKISKMYVEASGGDSNAEALREILDDARKELLHALFAAETFATKQAPGGSGLH